jgi:hypothetical protein
MPVDRVTQAPPITSCNHVGVDFEGTTVGGLSLKTIGVWNYLHHPDQETFLVAICTGDQEPWVGHPKDYDWSLIDFGKSLQWFALLPNQAKGLAALIEKHADELLKK